ncbi:hypothetical protein MRX96_048104 [Rhipicephalus microplus]
MGVATATPVVCIEATHQSRRSPTCTRDMARAATSIALPFSCAPCGAVSASDAGVPLGLRSRTGPSLDGCVRCALSGHLSPRFAG